MDSVLEHLVIGAASTGFLLLDTKDEIVWANPAGRAIADGARVLPLTGAVPDGAPVEQEWHDQDGVRGWLEVRCHEIVLSGQRLFLYELRDVSSNHRERERDRTHAWRLARLEQLANMGTWEWDVHTGEIAWSDALLSMFGFPPDKNLDYETYRSMLHPDDVSMIEAALDHALKTGESFSYTHRMYLADFVTLRVFECYGEVFCDDSGTPYRVLGTAHDITEMSRVQEELAYLADHDPLTGLPNRRALLGLLDRLAERRRREGALLLIDVDNFKDINDVYGHAVGDDVLRALARRLRPVVPSGGTLGRLGGDEFAVVLPDADVTEALALAERICDIAAGSLVPVADKGLRVTLSVGAAGIDSGRTKDETLAHADLALYESKDAGRNRARLFVPEQYRDAVQRVNVVTRVRAALDRGHLELDAQPIVDLATRKVTSYEVLVRLRDGLRPPLGPSDFLPTVERSDLIHELDHWVLSTAVATLADPAAIQAALCLNVNISARSLESPTFGTRVVDMLRQAGVDPHRLSLEVTETAAISNVEAVYGLAQQLSDAGCQFALDDFGAGFGSFAYLKNLPFTTVKIAGEFVQHADVGGADPVLVDAVVRAAHGLGMRVVAEYVDREPLVPALKRLGVDAGQGFHLGVPSPLSDLIDRHRQSAGTRSVDRTGASSNQEP